MFGVQRKGCSQFYLWGVREVVILEVILWSFKDE